jgi:hypothetical protein
MSAFGDLLDTICERVQLVRAIGDVLSAVDPQDLEAGTVRTLGLLVLREAGLLLEALKRSAVKSGTSGTSGTKPLSRG